MSSFYVGGGNGALTTNDFFIAYDLYDTRHIRLIQTLEPAFAGANPNAFFTFLGFTTDGTVAPPTPRTRSIELVGDSISAGYGSRGHAGTPFGCPVDDNTSGNYYTYNWMLAEAFNADITVIAWSGKGLVLKASHPAQQKQTNTTPKNKPLPKPYQPLNPNQTGCTKTVATLAKRCPLTTCRRSRATLSRRTGRSLPHPI